MCSMYKEWFLFFPRSLCSFRMSHALAFHAREACKGSVLWMTFFQVSLSQTRWGKDSVIIMMCGVLLSLLSQVQVLCCFRASNRPIVFFFFFFLKKVINWRAGFHCPTNLTRLYLESNADCSDSLVPYPTILYREVGSSGQNLYIPSWAQATWITNKWRWFMLVE